MELNKMAMAAAKKETSVTKVYYHPMDNAKLLREDGSEIIFVCNYYVAVGEKDIEFLDKESDHPATGVEAADMETPQAKRYIESVEAKKKRDEAEVEANKLLLRREDVVPVFSMAAYEEQHAAVVTSSHPSPVSSGESGSGSAEDKREGAYGTTGVVNTGNLTRDQPAVSTSTTHGQNRDKK
jgi:hypothetical protein